MKITIGPITLDILLKITIGPITLDILLFLRLCLPATVFIGLCTGILLAFNPVLLLLDQVGPSFIGWAWLLLLIFYILLGVAFTYFAARLLRGSFGSEEWRVQRRMAILSGFPFYTLCLLGLMGTLVCFLFPDMVNGPTIFASEIGFLGFALVSCSYLLLLRFFLRGSTAMLKVK